MARKNEAEQLLRQGYYPASIAREMRISVRSVIQYLQTRVGEGALRLSDLYFSWPPEKREVMQHARQGGRAAGPQLSANDLTRDDLYLFQSLRNSRVFA